ncbi:MAG: DUF1176 domain-containing protein [Brevundimonas sp.]|uniref:DUF1176 domain-containing protein n=1 Tax=Brevundimonas sp. TaxID=1871086 RepID=UPI0025BF8E5F|nr:DUF1176 domain-containing protein [Brevundimonas sp.]MBX3478260.1 DUF1176 domain-containing protein [Brevundimonas sp.]
MRTIIIAGTALLAACGAEPEAVSARAPDGADPRVPTTAGVQPVQRAFRDWMASCDNGADCVVFAGPTDGATAWLRVSMPAGPMATPVVHAGLWDGGGAQNAAAPLRLQIDGREEVIGPDPDPDLGQQGVGRASGPQADVIIRALGDARRLVLVKGSESAALSPNGAAAALLWIDERQGRLDTVTALRRRGDRPASDAPGAPALPVVAPAPAADQAGLPAADRNAALPAAFAALPAVRECRSNLDWNPDLFKAVTRQRLDARTELWGVPCDAGAYNLMTRYWITGPDGADPRAIALQGTQGEPQDVLTNAEYDPATRILRQFAKGRGIGDCGVFQAWTWTGRAFVLSQERVMGECWGVPFELWPTQWRTRER